MGKGTGAAPEQLGGTAIKPEGWDRTGMEAFKYFLYNPKTGEILSRTPLSWVKITVFYTIYYSCLAGFWLACLNIFFLTLPNETSGPKWKQDYSLIGSNPGVGLRPQNSDKRIDSQMFILQAGDTNKVPTNADGEGDYNADYATRMHKFLAPYREAKDFAPKKYDGALLYKKFELSTLKDCQNEPYGFVAKPKEDGEDSLAPANDVAPCIFVKFNKIWDWIPTPIDDAYVAKVKGTEDEIPQTVLDRRSASGNPDQVWMDCVGRNAADKEALEGNMEYFPSDAGIPVSYFPYAGKTDHVGNPYLSPLVAVKITPTAKTIGQLVHVECRAYFHGAKHDAKDKIGLVQFEVLVEAKKY